MNQKWYHIQQLKQNDRDKWLPLDYKHKQPSLLFFLPDYELWNFLLIFQK